VEEGAAPEARPLGIEGQGQLIRGVPVLLAPQDPQLRWQPDAHRLQPVDRGVTGGAARNQQRRARDARHAMMHHDPIGVLLRGTYQALLCQALLDFGRVKSVCCLSIRRTDNRLVSKLRLRGFFRRLPHNILRWCLDAAKGGIRRFIPAITAPASRLTANLSAQPFLSKFVRGSAIRHMPYLAL